ncbi:sensor histidine kinase [Capillimicrobium parvum]|uniref:histidine kinase n=1 Tax=Capillimicrobium parvum TaxID=2884022 RepID=A0A9E6XVG8_9ACTN|nr:HAMP domain-containing sensor histidine kinase [Capillimicrobium parvum]UGS35149.1 Adaptive-response sensory-kinase SasA [Capillimicrobium parvum]
MRSLPISIRARLTALYAALFLAAGAVLLGISYWLVSRHFDRTLPDDAAASALADLRGQYLLALAGTTLVSVALGWVMAGRVLRPLSEITATARRVSQDRLEDERIALGGPQDELRELADTFDAMLDRLAAAFSSQRRFVANASHELRTPLTVLRAEVEVTLADPDARMTDLRGMGETVRDAVVECEALLDGLLVLARSDAGLERREPVDLAAAAWRAAGRTDDGLAVELTVSAPEPVVIEGDPALLARMVANLVENAVRHNVPGGWATVDVHVRAGGAEVVVANSGAPVPVASAARLLEPFQRLARRGDGPPGAGLGLSIVRSVAEAHGGAVELEPRPGGGLRVTVRLPATWSEATPGPAPAANAADPAGRRPDGDTLPVAAARS